MADRTAYYSQWAITLFEGDEAVAYYEYPIGPQGPSGGDASARKIRDAAVRMWKTNAEVMPPFRKSHRPARIR